MRANAFLGESVGLPRLLNESSYNLSTLVIVPSVMLIFMTGMLPSRVRCTATHCRADARRRGGLEQ
jgi:hypothetical protein